MNESKPKIKRVNAVVTILCQDSDLEGVKYSLSSYEPLFNSKYKYPYVFLNNRPFSARFKKEIFRYVQALRGGQVPEIKFSLIPKKDWDYPPYINKESAKKALEANKNAYIYGGLESYRFMIRYFSGPFFRHPDLLEYDYYWRGLYY